MGILGATALVFALLVSIGTALVFLATAGDNRRKWTLGKAGVFAAFGLVTLAVLALEIALVGYDFSVVYVADYTSRALPLPYLLTGLWAGNGGSMLFWAWVLSICAAVLMWRWKERGRDLLPVSGAVTMAVLAFFLILIIGIVNPFKTQTDIPVDGHGLNPLLQNPAMIVHPPSLLAGYVVFTIPFAIGIAALAGRKLGEDWLIKARGWTIAAWLLLGAGNLLGMWWAYVELGWGGYWAWDPVENAGLMPWLVGTAFLHSMNIQRRRKTFKTWTLGLLIFTFFLTVFGTFLTRSDLSAIHGFGTTGLEPAFIIFLLVVFIGSFWLLYARRNDLRSPEEIDNPASREGTFFLTNVLLLGSTLAILIGTVFPFFLPLVNGQRVEVNKTFFNVVNVPIFMIIIVLTGICVAIGWRKANWKELGKDLLAPGIVFLFVLAGLFMAKASAVVAIGYSLGAFGGVATIMQGARELIARSRVKAEPGQQRMSMLAFVGVNKDRYGAYIMHLALAIFLIGIVGSSLLDARQDIVLKPGESVTVKNYTLTYEGLEFQGGVDKMNFVANVAVASKGKDLGTLKPAKASYTGYEQQYTEVAIRSTPAEDIYVILGTSDTDLLANVHDSKSPQAFSILVNPLVMWVWIGGMLLLAGGVICFWPRRELAPAVVQARQPTVPAPPTPPASPGKPMPQAQPARQAQTQQRQARPLSRRAQRRRAR